MNYLRASMQRRDFLRSLAQVGVLLPFASQVLPGGRLAAAPRKAHRLLMVYYPNGAVLDHWHPRYLGKFEGCRFFGWSAMVTSGSHVGAIR